MLGRALGNNPDNTDMASMEISEDLALDSSTSGFTLLMVMRMVPSDDPEEELDTDTPIIKGLDASVDPDNPKSWTLEWEEEDESDPVLTFKTTDKPGDAAPATLDGSLEINEWYIVRITIDSDSPPHTFLKAYNLHLNSEAAIDGVLKGQGICFSINTEGIKLNWNSVEIAEILLYDDVVEDVDVEEIIEFLIDDKYNPSY